MTGASGELGQARTAALEALCCLHRAVAPLAIANGATEWAQRQALEKEHREARAAAYVAIGILEETIFRTSEHETQFIDPILDTLAAAVFRLDSNPEALPEELDHLQALTASWIRHAIELFLPELGKTGRGSSPSMRVFRLEGDPPWLNVPLFRSLEGAKQFTLDMTRQNLEQTQAGRAPNLPHWRIDLIRFEEPQTEDSWNWTIIVPSSVPGEEPRRYECSVSRVQVHD